MTGAGPLPCPQTERLPHPCAFSQGWEHRLQLLRNRKTCPRAPMPAAIFLITPCQAPFYLLEIPEPSSFLARTERVRTFLYSNKYFVRAIFAPDAPLFHHKSPVPISLTSNPPRAKITTDLWLGSGMPVSRDGYPSPQKVVRKALFDNSTTTRKVCEMAGNKQVPAPKSLLFDHLELSSLFSNTLRENRGEGGPPPFCYRVRRFRRWQAPANPKTELSR